jgi:hypothetical protein
MPRRWANRELPDPGPWRKSARRSRELRGIIVKVSIAYRSLKLERILSANL